MAGSESSVRRSPPSPPLPWRARFLIALLSICTDASRRSDFTVNRRFLFLDRPTPANPNPVRGVCTADLTVDASRNLWLRLYIPDTAASSSSAHLPLIVFFHGGGFAFLSPASAVYDAVCRRISREVGAVVASVCYRLAPEHKHPAQYEDGVDALAYLDGERFADDCKAISLSHQTLRLGSCFLAGDSAGANIAHHVARRWSSAGHNPLRVNLAGLVSIQPFFGGEERTESEMRLWDAPISSPARTDWMWRAYLPEGEDRDHPAVNVFGPKDDKELEEGYPPAVVVVGGYDPLQDWQRRYYKGLKGRGKDARLVEYPDAIHAFYVFPEMKESGLMIDVMKEFIMEKLGSANNGK